MEHKQNSEKTLMIIYRASNFHIIAKGYDLTCKVPDGCKVLTLPPTKDQEETKKRIALNAIELNRSDTIGVSVKFPSDQVIDIEKLEIKNQVYTDPLGYRFKRRCLYPSIGNQLDAIMKMAKALKEDGVNISPEAEEWVSACLKVKSDVPKG